MFTIENDGPISDYLNAFANVILNHAVLKVNSQNLQITEVEFYYQTSLNDIHNDPYVHGDDHQLTTECFYFHRQNGKSYKGGTFKGLDITFGNGRDTYGGILIRAVIFGNEYIEGPCKVVDKILELSKCDSINKLVDGSSVPLSINNKDQIMYIEYLEKGREDMMFSGPRVGLSLPKSRFDAKLNYILRPLRFTTYPNKTTKYRNLLAMHALSIHSEEDVCKCFGLKKNILKGWINSMTGFTGTIADLIENGIDKVEHQCALYGLLKHTL